MYSLLKLQILVFEKWISYVNFSYFTQDDLVF